MGTSLRFKQYLAGTYLVRLHMTVIVLATTTAGLMISKILLEAGLTNVLVRYPLSVVGAYFTFLGLARLWSSFVLWRESKRERRGRNGSPNWRNLVDGASSPGHSSVETFAGGHSGGAGASGWWEPDHSSISPDSFELHDVSIDFDLGEAAGVAIVLVGLILVTFGAGVYVIYCAPDILPEVALNIVLTSGLTGVAIKARSKRWIYGVLRSTGIALALVLITSFGLAVLLHHRCPGAEKLADVRVCMPAR
jgi:hypothetical protein